MKEDQSEENKTEDQVENQEEDHHHHIGWKAHIWGALNRVALDREALGWEALGWGVELGCMELLDRFGDRN